jgi:hypothetical protein
LYYPLINYRLGTISIVNGCEFLYKNDNFTTPELPFSTQKLTSFFG